MNKVNDLTIEAVQGFNRNPVSYPAKSPAWYAYHLGQFMYITGRTSPCNVRMSGIRSIRCNDMLFEHTGSNKDRELIVQVFERLR